MMQEIHIGEVTGLAFGGKGIIRKENLVVFIPFAAEGDLLHYRIIQSKKNYAMGEIVEIIRPGPHRTHPLCPYFGTCGGCQLQHISYSAQLEAKRKWVEEALRRTAGFKNISVPPLVSSHQHWAYRRRISLTLRPCEGHFKTRVLDAEGKDPQGSPLLIQNSRFKAGYIAIDNTSLLEVNQCPIFASSNDPILAVMQEIVKELIPADKHEGKASIMKSDAMHYLLHFHFKALPQNMQDVIEKASKRYRELSGIVATSPKKSLHAGLHEIHCHTEDLDIAFSPKAFIQTHPEQSLNIYLSLCKHVEELKPKKVLDLYCGIGISSLLLARRGIKVMGVEANAEAVRLAKENAKRNHIQNTSFVKGDVAQTIGAMLKKEAPDLVIVNPPREGLATEVVQAFVKLPPPHLIYISCNPMTLSRDLKPLCQTIYRLGEVQAFDMFPQTTHLETLIVLIKN